MRQALVMAVVAAGFAIACPTERVEHHLGGDPIASSTEVRLLTTPGVLRRHWVVDGFAVTPVASGASAIRRNAERNGGECWFYPDLPRCE